VTESLDNILSGQKEELPAQEEKTEVVAQEQERQEQPEASEQEQTGTKMVPHEALHAEKQKVKRYTEEVAEFRRTNEALQRQIAELLQRVPVPQQQQPPQVEWFEDPRGAFKQDFQQSIDPILSPVKQQLQSLSGEIARMRAERVFGDKLGEFLTFVQENQSNPEVIALQAAMESAPDPYAYAKDWYEKKTFDPNAERERIKQELLQELQSQQAQQATPQVMPSNLVGARNVGSRSGPQWSGPPTLADIFKR
jgi:hypothetical protein